MPIRTNVAPSSIATSKSLLIPIERSLNCTPAAPACAASIAHPAQALKERPRVFRVVEKRRHGHQSFEFQIGEFADLFAEREDFVRRGACFRRFVAEIDFDEDRQPLAGFARDVVEPFSEFEAFDRMHDVEEFDSAPRLVRLQMPDQMPLNFVIRG